MKLILLDTETTGLAQPHIVELCFKDISEGAIEHEMFKPPVPIEIEAMATHHITNEDVENLSPLTPSSFTVFKLQDWITREKGIVIAHNAEFDLLALKNAGIEVPWFICTKKVAYHYLPDQPKHNLQYLRYALKLYDPKNKQRTAHDAKSDVLALQALFTHLMPIVEKAEGGERQAIAKMITISRNPLLLRSMPFGKHKGKMFLDILKEDRGYFDFILNKMEDCSADLRFTCEYWLKNGNAK